MNCNEGFGYDKLQSHAQRQHPNNHFRFVWEFTRGDFIILLCLHYVGYQELINPPFRWKKLPGLKDLNSRE